MLEALHDCLRILSGLLIFASGIFLSVAFSTFYEDKRACLKSLLLVLLLSLLSFLSYSASVKH
jgi:hypothetical protein